MMKKTILWHCVVALLSSLSAHATVEAGVLVGKWDFENTYQDSSGNGYHFTPLGTPSFVQGVNGGVGVDFDGGSTDFFGDPGLVDALDTNGSLGGHPSRVSFNATGLSVMSWVNPDDLTFGATLLSQDRSVQSARSYGYSVGIAADGRLSLGMRDSADNRLSVFSTATIDLNTWTHVAATWDGSLTGGMKLYINGVEVTTTLSKSGTFAGLQGPDVSIRSGATHGDSANTIYGFDGALDNLSLWSGSLTAEEISADFRLGAHVAPEPMSLAIFGMLAYLFSLNRRRSNRTSQVSFHVSPYPNRN
ncbi:MAG: LamG domain-containing protein [Pirellulaceae bacterium]